jgi:hypothetical protein
LTAATPSLKLVGKGRTGDPQGGEMGSSVAGGGDEGCRGQGGRGWGPVLLWRADEPGFRKGRMHGSSVGKCTGRTVCHDPLAGRSLRQAGKASMSSSTRCARAISLPQAQAPS